MGAAYADCMESLVSHPVHRTCLKLMKGPILLPCDPGGHVRGGGQTRTRGLKPPRRRRRRRRKLKPFEEGELQGQTLARIVMIEKEELL